MLLCREESLTRLSRLLPPPPAPLPACVVLSGPPGSGKRSVAAAAAEGAKKDLRWAWASCQEATVHPRLLFESLLCQLRGLDRCSGPGMASPVRCDAFGDFVSMLADEEEEDGGGGVVLVLRRAERLRDLDANLLPGFVRLRELTRFCHFLNFKPHAVWQI